MIDIAEKTHCKDCGAPLVQAERQGPHKKEFCNPTCRQRWHRKQQAKQAQEAVRQRWADYLPSTQEMLEEIMQAHGEHLASRVVDAISDEQEAQIAALEKEIHKLQERRDIETRFRTDTQVRHFKSWLRR